MANENAASVTQELTVEAKEVCRSLRKIADTEKPLNYLQNMAQVLVPRSQCADVVVDGITWFICYGIELALYGEPAHHLSISHPDRVTDPPAQVIDLLAKEFGISKERRQWGTQYRRRGWTIHLMASVDPGKEITFLSPNP